MPILDRLYRQADSAGEVKQGLKALLLCPTRELAQQVEKHIAQVTAPHRRLRTVLLIGGISLEKQRRLLSKAPDVIVATPGRFWHWLDEENDRHLRALKTSLQFLVIDEVDRMLQGGHFAELEHIFQFIKDEKMEELQTMVFSATLTNTSQPSGKPSSMGIPLFSARRSTTRTETLCRGMACFCAVQDTGRLHGDSGGQRDGR